MYPEDDPDKLFCWHVFGSRFQFQSGFKNDPDGDPDGFMWVVREAYEYAKEHWDWDGDDLTVDTNETVISTMGVKRDKVSPYGCIKGIVRFMTLVADRLEKGIGDDGFPVNAKCFFAALAQARAERTAAVEEERNRRLGRKDDYWRQNIQRDNPSRSPV